LLLFASLQQKPCNPPRATLPTESDPIRIHFSIIESEERLQLFTINSH